MEMCLGARAGSHEMAEMTGQTRRVDEELGGTGMNAVREPWEAAGVTRLLPEPRGGPVMPLVISEHPGRFSVLSHWCYLHCSLRGSSSLCSVYS